MSTRTVTLVSDVPHNNASSFMSAFFTACGQPQSGVDDAFSNNSTGTVTTTMMSPTSVERIMTFGDLEELTSYIMAIAPYQSLTPGFRATVLNDA